MEQDVFFRMNFVIQDSTATTTRTYTAKIIEEVLFGNQGAMDIDEIMRQISETYQLEFSEDELRMALSYGQRKSGHIIREEDKYFLEPEFANKLSHSNTAEDMLKHYTELAVNELGLEISCNELYELMTRYLYFCFNSNKNTLLSLIGGEPIKEKTTFKASNEEILYINRFLAWNNEDKNKLIYQMISYCYIYCTLNTRQDALLSASLFVNKHFVLDANIIFRLAGINRNDRKKTVQSFVEKCRDAKIRLSYTNVTYDEIHRVIAARTNWIRGVTHSAEPLDGLNLEDYGNDFYNLYVEWCKKPNNRYDDFKAFQNYLTGLVNEVLQQLEYIPIANYHTMKAVKFQSYYEALKKYKRDNSLKVQSESSLSTDVNNIMYVMEQREKGRGENIFSTNIFFISADQVLIGWSEQVMPGVPLIVLPSVWLTILLRFTGRSKNDYEAFCAFLGLRSHEDFNDIDVFAVIRELGFHTDSKELKEKIVSEVIDHKNSYNDMGGDIQKVVEKAFDTIIEKDAESKELEFKRQIANREEQLEREKKENAEIIQRQERAKTLVRLVQAETDKKLKWIKGVKYAFISVSIVIGLAFIFSTVMWAFDINPCFEIYENIIPDKFETVSDKWTIIMEIAAVLGAVYTAVVRFLNFLLKEPHRRRLEEKLRKKYSYIEDELELENRNQLNTYI